MKNWHLSLTESGISCIEGKDYSFECQPETELNVYSYYTDGVMAEKTCIDKEKAIQEFKEWLLPVLQSDLQAIQNLISHVQL